LSLAHRDHAVYTLFLNADEHANPPQKSPFEIFKQLLSAELDTEPMTVLDELAFDELLPEELSWCSFLLVSLYGLSAALLLLNLLIAVFSKSVETISQDLDSNFKLKFGQVVVHAREAGLVPRPLNLVRYCALGMYGMLNRCSQGRARWLVQLLADRMAVELDNLGGSSSGSEPHGSISGSTEYWQEYSMVAAFVERALSAEVRLLPEGIIDGARSSESVHENASSRQRVAAEREAEAQWRRGVSEKLSQLGEVSERLDKLTLLIEQMASHTQCNRTATCSSTIGSQAHPSSTLSAAAARGESPAAAPSLLRPEDPLLDAIHAALDQTSCGQGPRSSPPTKEPETERERVPTKDAAAANGLCAPAATGRMVDVALVPHGHLQQSARPTPPVGSHAAPPASRQRAQPFGGVQRGLGGSPFGIQITRSPRTAPPPHPRNGRPGAIISVGGAQLKLPWLPADRASARPDQGASARPWWQGLVDGMGGQFGAGDASADDSRDCRV
jgi:hypothetical protein